MEIFLTINIPRLHPLLVHMPIGILFFAFFLEIWKWWKKKNEYDSAIGLALMLTALFSVVSAGSGWLLSQEGGYDEAGLFWHKWMGLSMTALSILLYFSHRSKSKIGKAIYFPLLISTLSLLTLTGHFGGNITHGEGFLFSKSEEEAITVADIGKANIYESIVAPIFKSKCNSCHNPGKKKGDLLMTTPEFIIKGGKSGPLINFDSPEKSELLNRIHLPLTEEEHMPPKGKKQLDGDEIKLLEWWLNNKACFDCIVENAKGNESVQPILEKYTVAHNKSINKNIPPLPEGAVEKLQATGVRAFPLADGSPAVSINLSNQKKSSRAIFKKITSLGKNIVELNLSHSSFSDEDAWVFGEMPNLKKIQLQKTDLSDRGLKAISELKYLEWLNIYGTKITDQSIKKLKQLPALKKLYCWQSGLSEKGLNELAKAKPQLEIQFKIDNDFFGEAILQAPEIIAESDFFNDSLKIELKSNFRNTKIYFTSDGSEPDSNSTLYTAPFHISKTSTIKAFSKKENWDSSPISTRKLISSDIKIAAVTLSKPPNEKYKADGANSIYDKKRGTLKFTEGMWLGYEGEHLTTTIKLEREETISKVFVSTLSAPGSWILPPESCEISVSKNGSNFNIIKKIDLSDSSLEMETQQNIFEIPVEPTNARYVRVNVKSPIKLPKWHPAAGNKCWLFVDEIILN